MSKPLDPALAAVIQILPLRDAATMTPARARGELSALAAARAAVPPPPVRSVCGISLAGPAGPIAARVYRIREGKAPTVVFFHGGGWVAGDIETHDRQARLLAIETGAVVVSVDYRRPPEAKFPAAFDDCVAAVRAVVTDIGAFGDDAARVGVSGDSAGGNLAAAAALACRDAGLKLAGQLLVYPATDLAGAYADEANNALYPSRTENAEGYFLSHAMMKWFAREYLSDAKEGLGWRASPLRGQLAGVAPAVVTTAHFDPLRDEGQAYAQALIDAGVPTKRHYGSGLIHGYFGMGDASEAAQAEARRARADFKALLDSGA